MRLPVSLLVLCAAITGCTPSIDPALVEVVSINSNPQGAAFRLNGVASGRTPAEVSLDRSVDYKLEVGKGGYEGEVRYLKPSLQNTKDGLSFGFGKTPAQNLQLVRELGRFAALGYPVLLGTSRKSTLGLVLR